MPILTRSHIHTWFNEPIAVTVNGSSYYGFYSLTGQVSVGKYDHTKQILEIGSPRLDPITIDDHNNPALIVLNTGKILTAYTHHPGACWAAISNNPYDVTGGWTETQLYDGSTYNNSYAHLCQTTDDQNTIWWFFRDGVSGSRPITIRFNQSGGNGNGWTASSDVVKLIFNGSSRPYFRIVQSGRRIDILYNDGNAAVPEGIVNSLYHVYIIINQAGTQFSVYKSDGQLIDTWNITGGTGVVNSISLPFSVSLGTVVYDGTTQKSWVWDTRYVAGNLYCAYVVFNTSSATDDAHKYRRASYNGTSWTNEDICFAGDSLVPSETGRIPHWIVPDANPGSNAVYSPGICLDPNIADRVYVGKKYASQDVRIQQWDKTSNTWSKTSDLTGPSGNNAVNARPFAVLNSNPSNIIWFCSPSYSSWDSYTIREPGTLLPLTLARTTKIANAAWYSQYAPKGLQAFYLMNDVSGSIVRDVTGRFNASVAGSLSWGSDGYGSYLSGFSSTASITAHSLARSGYFDSNVYPKWAAVLYKSLDGTAGKYLLSMGNSGNNNYLLGLSANTNADNWAGAIYRDVNNVANQVVSVIMRDTNYHTSMIVIESPSSMRFYHDGIYRGKGTNNIGSVLFNTATIGGLIRTTQSNPATNCIISCAQFGTGLIPSPEHIDMDMINGQFLGSWPLNTSYLVHVKHAYLKHRPGLNKFYLHIG